MERPNRREVNDDQCKNPTADRGRSSWDLASGSGDGRHPPISVPRRGFLGKLLVTVDAATSGPEEVLAGRYAGGALGAAVQLVIGIAVGVVMFLIRTPFLV